MSDRRFWHLTFYGPHRWLSPCKFSVFPFGTSRFQTQLVGTNGPLKNVMLCSSLSTWVVGLTYLQDGMGQVGVSAGVGCSPRRTGPWVCLQHHRKETETGKQSLTQQLPSSVLGDAFQDCFSLLRGMNRGPPLASVSGNENECSP